MQERTHLRVHKVCCQSEGELFVNICVEGTSWDKQVKGLNSLGLMFFRLLLRDIISKQGLCGLFLNSPLLQVHQGFEERKASPDPKVLSGHKGGRDLQAEKASRDQWGPQVNKNNLKMLFTASHTVCVYLFLHVLTLIFLSFISLSGLRGEQGVLLVNTRSKPAMLFDFQIHLTQALFVIRTPRLWRPRAPSFFLRCSDTSDKEAWNHQVQQNLCEWK